MSEKKLIWQTCDVLPPKDEFPQQSISVVVLTESGKIATGRYLFNINRWSVDGFGNKKAIVTDWIDVKHP